MRTAIDPRFIGWGTLTALVARTQSDCLALMENTLYRCRSLDRRQLQVQR
jgi:hypothetical protein